MRLGDDISGDKVLRWQLRIGGILLAILLVGLALWLSGQDAGLILLAIGSIGLGLVFGTVGFLTLNETDREPSYRTRSWGYWGLGIALIVVVIGYVSGR